MKIALVLLWLLPIVAFAFPNIPRMDIKEVVKDVQLKVDDDIERVVKDVLKAIKDTDAEETVAKYKQKLDTLQQQPQEQFEETKKQVNEYLGLLSMRSPVKAGITARQIEFDRDQFDDIMNHKMDIEIYGDLKEKVSLALKNAPKDFYKTLDSAKDKMVEAQKEVIDQLDSAAKQYDAAILKNPGYDNYHEAIDLLKQGWDKVNQIVKGKIEEANKIMDAVDVKKINDDIERTITGN